jgi:hypothetical protein
MLHKIFAPIGEIPPKGTLVGRERASLTENDDKLTTA